MSPRVKRTYNLTESTIRRVRELAGDHRLAETQDGVVEIAVERLYVDERARREAEAWAAARDDPEFQAEMADVARDFGDRETWPA